MDGTGVRALETTFLRRVHRHSASGPERNTEWDRLAGPTFTLLDAAKWKAGMTSFITETKRLKAAEQGRESLFSSIAAVKAQNHQWGWGSAGVYDRILPMGDQSRKQSIRQANTTSQTLPLVATS